MKGTDEHIVDATIKSDSLGVQVLPTVNIEASTEVCYSDITSNTWTLYGCDGGSTSCDSSNAAVSITGIVITGTFSIVVSSTTPTGNPTATASIPTTSKHNIIYLHDVHFIVSVSSTIIPSLDTSSSVPVLAIVVPVIAVTLCLTIAIIIIIVLGNVYIFVYYYVQL